MSRAIISRYWQIRLWGWALAHFHTYISISDNACCFGIHPENRPFRPDFTGVLRFRDGFHLVLRERPTGPPSFLARAAWPRSVSAALGIPFSAFSPG
jgi:hypothetical protein